MNSTTSALSGQSKSSKIKNKTKLRPFVNQLATSIATLAEGKSVKTASKQMKATNAITKNRNAPVNTNFTYRNKPPTYTGLKHGIRIQHTEFVTDLSSSVTAQAYLGMKFNLNPGNTTLFPWLADIALNYSTFIPHSIEFYGESIVGTSLNGTMFGASTPDCIDDLPATKAAFLQLENATRCNIWENFRYKVPVEDLRRLPEYLVAIGNTGTDSTRSLGAFFLGSSGLSSSAVDYGELYVRYDITFLHPQPTSGMSMSFSDFGVLPNAAFLNCNSDTATNNYFGNIHGKSVNPDGVAGHDYLRVDRSGSFSFQYCATTSVAATVDTPSIAIYDEKFVLLNTFGPSTSGTYIGSLKYNWTGAYINAPCPHYVRFTADITGLLTCTSLRITQMASNRFSSFEKSVNDQFLLNSVNQRLQLLEEDVAKDKVNKIEETNSPPTTESIHAQVVLDPNTSLQKRLEVLESVIKESIVLVSK